MIRFINCLRRKTEVSEMDFRRYWDADEFAELVSRMAKATGAQHYQMKRTLVVEANERIREIRGGADPFDGTIEYWFAGVGVSLDELLEISANRKLMEDMIAYQSRFVDTARSCGYFTEG